MSDSEPDLKAGPEQAQPTGETDLESLAYQLAASGTVSHRPGRRPVLLERLRDYEVLLRRAHQSFKETSEEQLTGAAVEWMLDNYYIVQQTLRQVREDMPKSYYRQLPELDTAPLKGYPRVYALARAILKSCDRHLNLDQVRLFVRAYQRVAPLEIGELWALPTMLRLSVLETLTQVIVRLTGLQMMGTDGTLASEPPSSEQADEATVANCIFNLRILATQDWKTFVESVSHVEQVLHRDPADVYARMDSDTRDRYRGVVEELALATGRDEEVVAREAVRLAEEAQSDGLGSPRASHVGFYLVDAGRTQLEARLNYLPPWGERLHRWLIAHPTLPYLGSIGLLTLSISLSLVLYALNAGGTLIQLIGVGLLVLLPSSAVAIDLVHWLITHTVPPRILSKMEFSEGIPVQYRTMVVVPALLTSDTNREFLLRQLELHYLGNTDPHLHFALLTDFADAPHMHMPEDDPLIEQLQQDIQALNKKYRHGAAGPFYLFHRYRQWNPGEDTWMAWERKRGKLVEFNRLLGGSEKTSYNVQVGDLDFLPEIKYVITLDADTVLPREGAQRLIATLAHPLNRAEFDPNTGQVVAGYTVLQPRVQIKPSTANRSLFTRIYSGDVGLDPYTRAISDVYQDLFGEGSYVGKGIYDVAAFERSLAGRSPDNALLSHDLFEGIHGRAGLVTEMSLFEDYPLNYLSQAHRLHRWVRGDWQLLPWVLPRVPHAGDGTIPNDLSALDRWKIVDNLRRSLLSPALLALLLAGWVWFPGSALVWTLTALLALALPFLSRVATGLLRRLRGRMTRGAGRATAVRWLLALVFLPCDAIRMLDAIGCTLIRMTVTHKRLLQWTTSAHTVSLFGKKTEIGVLWKQMSSAPVLALALALLMAWVKPAVLPVATPLLLAWLLSPLVAHWLDRPLIRKSAPISVVQQQQLRRIARRTWLYFEQFVGPEDHWLPPDHFQEDPRGLVTHSTSPTNIGLLLLSTLAAYDLGYIGLIDLAVRLRATLDNLEGLERCRGHFLNWYETRSLEPLPPRYVSTVDSGNLAGCLLALKQGCLDVTRNPVLRWQRFQGLLDAVDILDRIVGGAEGSHTYPRPGQEEIVSETPDTLLRAHLALLRQRVLAARDDPHGWVSLLHWLGEECRQELDRLLMALVRSESLNLDSAALHDLRIWSKQVRYQLVSLWPELDLLLPWGEPLSRPPALFIQPGTEPAIREAWQALRDSLPITPRLDEIAAICGNGRVRLAQLRELLDELLPADEGGLGRVEGGAAAAVSRIREARAWCEQLSGGLGTAGMTAKGILIGFQELGAQAKDYCQAMDFKFLFDSQRQVFHIGYNATIGKLDNNHYDLLASEARLASLVAIAKGDVPQSHWMHLARPLGRVNGTRALLSWSGTMFEYLMPSLLLEDYEGTLLDQTYRAVVDRQIAYGRRKNVPWGISESGYYRFDAGLNYQYRAFGVPGLGIKRGREEDLVISPYASLLAVNVRPRAVMDNIAHLIELQMLGPYGFYEAVDYTHSRLSLGQESGIVRSYMVHHHGMSLLAMVNYLQDDVMVRRLHADPLMQSVELLLHEQVPQQAPVERPSTEDAGVIRPIEPLPATEPWRTPVHGQIPQAHFLSNGRLGLLITSAGSGYSHWWENHLAASEGVDLTRWRSDTTLDNWGTWIYVQDCDSGHLWSAGCQPTGVPAESQAVLYSAHQAEFRRRDHDISLRMEITVAPDDDVEIRRISLTNHSDHVRRLALTSYGEVVLAPQSADRRHQAFSKLFIESEYLPEVNGLLFRRRPRSAGESPTYMVHLLVVEPGREITGAHESDRARFLGRGGTVRSPAVLDPALHVGLSGTTGATLDPIMSLGQELGLEPQTTAQAAYLTLAAGSRQEALRLAHRYQAWDRIDRAFSQAQDRSERELHQLNLSTSEVKHVQQLFSALVHPHKALRADPETLAANTRGQPGLWQFAISGDYPILLVRVDSEDEGTLVHELLQAHAYWRNRHLKIDLVILNETESGYNQELQGRLYQLIVRTGSDAWINQRGGIFLLRADQIGETDRILLETAARVVLDGEKGTLAQQLERLGEKPTHLPRFVSTRPRPEAEKMATTLLARPTGLLFDNGLGGFSADGREYVIYLEPGQWTPAPWINVIANSGFGFLVSEAGSGYTWAENSGENRLTPWRNDPVADTPGEALYLRDEETGEVWSPTPLPAGASAPYLVRHGAGYSVFEHHSHGIKQRLRLFVVPNAPVKVIHLRLENTCNRNRRITATFYAEWVLGTTQDENRQYVIPEFDAVSNALLARNPYSQEFGQRVAFVTASREPYGLTADRTEFLGREGDFRRPAALCRVGLAGAVRAGQDPCAALQTNVWLAPGEVEELFFLLGQGADREETLQLIKQYQDASQVEAAWDKMIRFWDNLLGTLTVQVPDPGMNLLLNRWLLYQALSCRLWGRSALYQSSGAFGYRDQLQDVMSLVLAAPHLARDHILQAASYQFEAGDVLHWWHPPSGRGVRTRCSDDLLWLPFVTAHYVAATGDVAILSEKVPFLRGDPLGPEEHDRYGHYETTAEGYSLYEHCRRALDKGQTVGLHNLPLIGSHDWNDGYSRVGIEGKGESIWLGWFLHATLMRFAAISEQIDAEQAAAYRQQADGVRLALEANSWDGAWYRRAYYDDGTPMGSAENDECQIDSIAQSWAVLSGAADPARAAQAMDAVATHLVRQDDQQILLFTPPFDKTPHDPGYIKGYLPGIRENGGQYTHAALWVVWAFAELGQGDRAAALFQLLNPIAHSDTPEKVERYRVEPYVVAADVYSVPPHTGRGGWTWYTGSASWMYRLGTEAILGLRKMGKTLRIDPCIPKHWSGYDIIYRDGDTSYEIHVDNPGGVNRGVRQVILDGESLPDGAIPLLGDGRKHKVEIQMG